jgi:HK97 family phage portal protein
MNLLQRAVRSLATRALKYAGMPLRDPALVAMFGHDQEVTSGVTVDEDSALSHSAVFSAVSLISNAIAMMPMQVVKRNPSFGDELVEREHIVNHLLSCQPNAYQTPFVFHQTLQAHTLTHGNDYARITRAGGTPIDLQLLVPTQVQPEWKGTNEDTLSYTVKDGAGASDNVKPEDILHVPGLGFDGVTGYSVVKYARECIGLGLATERFGAAFFGNGATPSLVIKHPGDLTDKAQKNIKRGWKREHQGPGQMRGIALLDEGMEISPIGIPPEDSQFLQTRQFQVVEIARWFRVPPHMLYDMMQATFNNNESQGIDFLTYTLVPWMERRRQEYARKLLTPEERQTLDIQYDTATLLRADRKTRFEAYAMGRNGSWYTLNNIMRAEGMPLLPPEIGDIHVSPSTMKQLGSTDPTAPITTLQIQEVIEFLKANRPIDPAIAKDLVNAMLPTASDLTITNIVKLGSKT